MFLYRFYKIVQVITVGLVLMNLSTLSAAQATEAEKEQHQPREQSHQTLSIQDQTIHNPLVLLIGTSQYDDPDIPSLPGVDHDMKALEQLFAKAYGYEVHTTYYLNDTCRLTSEALEKFLVEQKAYLNRTLENRSQLSMRKGSM